MVGLLLFGALAVAPPISLTLHVDARPSRESSDACVFLIRNRIVEGGRQRTCLTSVDGYPTSHGVIRSRGSILFTLPHGAIRARVVITMRFLADGIRARQAVIGSIVGGSGSYAGVRGSISGGGSVVDRASGLGRVRLTYRLTLRR